MSMKNDLKITADYVYNKVKRKLPDIRYPCCGAYLDKYFLGTSWHTGTYFYLSDQGIVYTDNGVKINIIPYNSIRKAKWKQSVFRNFVIMISLKTKTSFRFYLSFHDRFSTELIGNTVENVEFFIGELNMRVNKWCDL